MSLGVYDNGKREGPGLVIFDYGESWEGIFKNNNMTKAIGNYPTGNWYFGDFSAETNKKEGQGTTMFERGAANIGGYKDGLANGPGICYYEDG